MEYRYDQSFQPPAPVVNLLVGTPGAKNQEGLKALIDSGAEVCVLPIEIIHKLQLRRVDVVQVQGFGAEPREAPVFSASISIGTQYQWIERVIPWGERYAMLGRDIINRWRIVLDGPAQMINIL